MGSSMNSRRKRSNMIKKNNITRRSLLKWAPPVAAAVSLPAHAQMSVCISTLNMTASVPSKCAGSPPVGNAVLQITSDGADPVNPELEIVSIAISGAAATDVVVLPALPATVSATTSADIDWTGNASDALTCLPLSTILFDVTFRCVGSSSTMNQSFNLTTVLADAIP